jgi:hypothetical protein
VPRRLLLHFALPTAIPSYTHPLHGMSQIDLLPQHNSSSYTGQHNLMGPSHTSSASAASCCTPGSSTPSGTYQLNLDSTSPG